MAHAKEAEHVATKCRKAPPSLQKFTASEIEVDADVADVVVGPGTSAAEDSPADPETPATNTRSRRAVISPSEEQSCNVYSAESIENLFCNTCLNIT